MPHIHEKIDFTVEVFIVFRDTVLLRFHDKYKIWLSVGGHIDLDEDPNQAALREVKEEVGLDVVLWDGNQLLKREEKEFKELIPPVSINRHRINESHEHVSMVYFATANSDIVVPEYASDRSDDWQWCTADDLKTMDPREDVMFYANQALSTLGK